MTAPKSRPILFSAPMIRAILDGRKSQTRRVVKNPEDYGCQIPGPAIITPYGRPLDRLWVRETFGLVDESDGKQCVYRADSGPIHEATTKWKPSIFMPRWASRITLEIISIRVERLQEISEADAIAEGISKGPVKLWKGATPSGKPLQTAKEQFKTLWDTINAKKQPWSSSPWVWVIEFKRV